MQEKKVVQGLYQMKSIVVLILKINDTHFPGIFSHTPAAPGNIVAIYLLCKVGLFFCSGVLCKYFLYIYFLILT